MCHMYIHNEVYALIVVGLMHVEHVLGSDLRIFYVKICVCIMCSFVPGLCADSIMCYVSVLVSVACGFWSVL